MAQDSVTGVSRRDPLKILAEVIANAVPALKNNVISTPTTVGTAGPSQPQKWPSLTVMVPPGIAWMFEYQQPSRIDRYDADHPTKPLRPKDYEVPDTFDGPGSTGSYVYSVGRHVGPILLRLGATSDTARAILEQAVLDVFHPRRGVIVERVPRCANAFHSWTLMSAKWDDEMTFDKALFSEIEVQAVHPLLVEVRGVRRMDTIRALFTEDMVTEWAQIPSGQIETFDIQPDGTVTRP
jgi:hypothetical protein